MIQPTTRAYKNILSDSSFLPGENITEGIPDQDRVLQIDRVTGSSLQDQPGFRLTAAAVILGGMGAHEDTINPAARRADLCNQPVIDPPGNFLADQTPANRGLVRDHQDLVLAVFDSHQGIECLGINSYIRPGANIIRSIFNNHSVPVQE